MAYNRDNDFTFVKCFALLPLGEGGRRPDEGLATRTMFGNGLAERPSSARWAPSPAGGRAVRLAYE